MEATLIPSNTEIADPMIQRTQMIFRPTDARDLSCPVEPESTEGMYRAQCSQYGEAMLPLCTVSDPQYGQYLNQDPSVPSVSLR